MERTWATGRQYEIEFGEQRAVITEIGAAIRAYQDERGAIIDGTGPDEPISAGRGQVLMPWPNRIRDGRYELNGVKQQLPITEVGKMNSSHGFLRWVNWTSIESERTASSVTMAYEAHAQPGYPFAFDARVTYSLSDAGLQVQMQATNTAPEPAPFGMGSHPYFTTGTDTIDSNTLQCPADNYLTADEQAAPIDEVPVDEATDYRKERPLDGESINACYSKLSRDSDGKARTYLRPGAASDAGADGIEVWMDETFDYVMLYTADDVPQPERCRKSVAIEPMSCAPNAFNNGWGLRMLEPGETFTGFWGVARTR